MGIFNIIKNLIKVAASILISMAICVNAILPSLEKRDLDSGSIAAILIVVGIILAVLFFFSLEVLVLLFLGIRGS